MLPWTGSLMIHSRPTRHPSFIDRRASIEGSATRPRASKLLYEAAQRNGPGGIERRPRCGCEGDYGTGVRLFVVAPRCGPGEGASTLAGGPITSRTRLSVHM